MRKLGLGLIGGFRDGIHEYDGRDETEQALTDQLLHE
jgi:hypothetical protein